MRSLFRTMGGGARPGVTGQSALRCSRNTIRVLLRIRRSAACDASPGRTRAVARLPKRSAAPVFPLQRRAAAPYERNFFTDIPRIPEL